MKNAIFSLVCLLFAIPCTAETITVDQNGFADFNNIQAAINDSNDGDTVVVADGTYYENIDFNGKSITLTSTDPNDPNVAAATIIDGNNLGTVVTIIDVNAVDANAVIDGFTITNGLSDANGGGGIYCMNSNLTLRRSNIIANLTSDGVADLSDPVFIFGTDAGGGAGLCLISSIVTISDCNISNNTTGHGGNGEFGGRGGNGAGLYALSSILNISDSIFTNNSTGSGGEGYAYYPGCGGDGGAIYFGPLCSVSMIL